MSVFNLSPVFPANEQRVIRRALRLLEKFLGKSCKRLLRVIFAREQTGFTPSFHLGAYGDQCRRRRQQQAQLQGMPAR